MKTTEIVQNIKLKSEIITSNSSSEIIDATLSSKEANEKSIFFAIKGFKTDGHKYINDAFSRGCSNFVVESIDSISENIKKTSTIIKVEDSRLALALFANHINGYVFDRLKVIGITGTKGKTTVTTLIYGLLNTTFKCGMFSTVKNIVAGIKTDSERTTMEANKLQSLLKQSFDAGETHSIVEVSSHAVTLKRIENINWDLGIFTTFSRDHLDLYGTMDNYFQAKLDFFRALNNSTKKNKIAIINIDDPKGEDVCSVINASVKLIRVGSKENADYKIEKYEINETGMLISIKYKNQIYKLKTKMRGIFNVNNIALAVSTALELGISFETITRFFDDFDGVEGRFEIIIEKPFMAIVDYAHTPDSLEKILYEARKLSSNKVISVFGCTGDRDKEKRPIMGEISAKQADFTVITNDDTYTEDPVSIAQSVEEGFLNLKKVKDRDYKIIYNRKDAIKEALRCAQKGDVIIIAGMGHEKHQIINNVAIDYSDKETILELSKNI
jgi:UDP-N-acetylmuramoyl-L-alanyl-D-glutamate--2,6-diaminopimelate ligase